MNRDYEALSAFLDGETNELETRRVLRDLDQADIATLGRWQLASDTLRGHASREVPPAFNARLSAALAAESKVRPGTMDALRTSTTRRQPSKTARILAEG